MQTAPAASSAPAGDGRPPVGSAEPALREAARQFEQLMLGQLLRDVTDGAVGDAGGAAPFASLLQDEYARLMARGGIGIADAVLRSLQASREKP